MLKRKRGQQQPSVALTAHSSSNRGPGIQTLRVEAKLEHGKKLLNRALKTAKGFERQKLGRRRKTAVVSNDAADVARIDREIEALKTLEIPSAAEHHLYKSLLKSKAVATSHALPSSVSEANIIPRDAAAVNVTARLYNSNPVKETLKEVLGDIRGALGIRDHVEVSQGKAKNGASHSKRGQIDTAEQTEQDSDTTTNGRVLAVDTGKHTRVSTTGRTGQSVVSSGDEDEFAVFDSSAAASPDGGSEDDDFSHFVSRIVASSDEESDDEIEMPESVRLKGRSKTTYEPDIELSPPTSPSPSRSPTPDLPDPFPKKHKADKEAAPKPNKSTFLPSLTMGGYWSGSESEPEDDDIDTAPKKNRRGQRARREIAEKKFGTKAKHLQNGSSRVQDRNKGWDPKRGAQSESGRRFGHDRHGGGGAAGRSGGRGGGQGGRTGANDVAVAKPRGRGEGRKDDQGPLHPSWEAAKRANEAKMTAAFEGKKITFD
ncbi:Bud-site selection protein [Cryomyces antarcticus]|uniref:Bud22 domain-containing protein n=1 Tax=Cryomyces antarcticus TaxID=329879 RepID=A0ABR0M048_9PEZI|nr:hypothetical protein LTR39_000232 [Cryomyces antarcticus]KAK5020041.1 hypothetical protein LTR60_000894 [Cryomyces antarcticus]KAK5257540.1 hypothetical protein LTR16_000364 [Cryomyces antarcticus]